MKGRFLKSVQACKKREFSVIFLKISENLKTFIKY